MKHILLTLLACCMMAVGVKAQLTYKDSKYGWSVTLPKGWEIKKDSTKKQSSGGLLDDDSAQDEEDKITFVDKQTEAVISVSITPTPDKYKGKLDEMAKDKKKILAKAFGKANSKTMKVKTKGGSTTIAGKKFATMKIMLYMEKKHIIDVTLYMWANDEQQLTIACSTTPQGERLASSTFNDALQQISSTIQFQ